MYNRKTFVEEALFNVKELIPKATNKDELKVAVQLFALINQLDASKKSSENAKRKISESPSNQSIDQLDRNFKKQCINVKSEPKDNENEAEVKPSTSKSAEDREKNDKEIKAVIKKLLKNDPDVVLNLTIIKKIEDFLERNHEFIDADRIEAIREKIKKFNY